MSVTFTCSHCHNEYIKDISDDKIIKRFKKWYPNDDLKTAKVVCSACYVTGKILEIERQRQSWINYAMNN